ncbi:NifB/NifX family molybdenum-iron cluster-binding protein [Anaeromusa acidaminophila]|uniref:NifB/NifX family molybdenum-iron cluster-binding protein n=1 Tax=Anaeromusa acidaminophila TaxID=81464 RepID=UPI000376EB9F|nr:NifB/NifX family molybdenum-iron cluster-binding protein [Anaeromusa acidaminophila]
MEKYGVPTYQGMLCAHFGHCEQFAIVAVENGQVQGMEMLTPPPHEPGVIPNWLAQQGVHKVIAGGMGVKAQMIFATHGIEVVCGAAAQEPQELVRLYLAGQLVQGDNPCSHEEGQPCTGHK